LRHESLPGEFEDFIFLAVFPCKTGCFVGQPAFGIGIA
jgi:hypothetical protein